MNYSRRNNRKNMKGNAVALVVAFLAILVLLLVPMFLNFNQLTGLHKQGQTAIDSAAIQAAKDISRIVVNGPLGRIALVDDPKPSNNGYMVKGINTVFGNLRLDALIASRLNNTSMLVLAKQDISYANQASQQLRNAINSAITGGGSCVDKNGVAIDLVNNARLAYASNPRTLGMKKQDAKSLSQGSSMPQNFSMQVGILNSRETNIPVPNCPNGWDTALDNSNTFTNSSGAKFYRANMDIPVPGLSGSNVRFASTSNTVGLVDNGLFQSGNSQDIPIAVQVSADEQLDAAAANSKTRSKGTVKVVATGRAGGELMPSSTGTLVVSFPQGFPQNPAAQAGDTSALNFSSVVGIMNGSQLSSASANPTSPYKYWNSASKGNWFKVSNGTIPGSGTSTATPYRGLTGRNDDDPSVCLSFLVYDWLKTLGLRPNVKSVVDALSFDLQNGLGNSTAAKTFTATGPDINLIPAALAAEETHAGVTTAIMTISDSGQDDPRNMLNFANNPEAYQRQQARMWGYLPADGVLQANAMLVSLQSDGSTTTIDGNPIGLLNEVFDQLNEMNTHAVVTFNNAVEVLNGMSSNGSGGSDLEINAKKLQKNPRLFAAIYNSMYCMNVCKAMRENLKALTGGGVKKMGNNHYVIMGTDFFPPSRSANKNELRADQGISSTGQNPMAKNADWCASPVMVNGSMSSALNFFKRSEEPVIGKKPHDQGSFTSPAYAQGTIPPNKMLKYVFHLTGNASSGSDLVQLHPMPTSPFASVPTLEGQVHYQNVSALEVASASDPNAKVIWQVQARDQGANAYDNSGTAATTFTNFTAPQYDKNWCSSQGGCPPLVSEFSLNCPTIQSPPTPPSPPTPVVPPAPTQPPQSFSCSFSGWTVVSETTIGGGKTRFAVEQVDKNGKVKTKNIDVYVNGKDINTGVTAVFANGGPIHGIYQYDAPDGASNYRWNVNQDWLKGWFQSTKYLRYYPCNPTPVPFAT